MISEILRIKHSLFSLSQGRQSPNLLTRSCLERHVSVCACAHSQVATRGGSRGRETRGVVEGGSTSERDIMVREDERVMFTRGRKRKGWREKRDLTGVWNTRAREKDGARVGRGSSLRERERGEISRRVEGDKTSTRERGI